MKKVKLGVKPAIIDRIVEGKPTMLKREINPKNENYEEISANYDHSHHVSDTL